VVLSLQEAQHPVRLAPAAGRGGKVDATPVSSSLRETEDPVRRIAWVTYLLVIGCAVGFVIGTLEALEVDAVVDTHLASAEEYFKARPYLEVPALLHRRISPSAAAEKRARFENQRKRRWAAPIPPRVIAREQRELDVMVEAARRRIDGLPARRWGLRADDRAPLSFATHLFSHAGWLHLLGNLLLLLVLGFRLEGAWGAAVFACMVSAATLGSGLGFVTQNPGYPEPLIGTTGLAAGLLGAFIVRFAGLHKQMPHAWVIPLGLLVLVLPLWFGAEWSIARGLTAETARLGQWNPSWWALTGGFGAGVLGGFVVRLLGLEGRIERAEVDAEVRRGAADPQLESALQERSAGQLDEAFHLLNGILRQHPEHLDAALALWDVANDLGRPRDAVPGLLRVIRHEVKCGDHPAALRHWLELMACNLDADADPPLLMRMAPLLREAGEREAAVQALRNALLRAGGASGTSVASRVAREASDLDPRTAEKAAWRALGSLELDLPERQELEDLLAELQPLLTTQEELDDAAAPRSFEAAAAVSAAEVAPPDSIDVDARSRDLEHLLAVPTGFDSEGLRIDVEGTNKRVRFDRIDAVSVAAVDGMGARTVIVVDLVLNWMSLTDEPLKLVRMRTDRFDPRRLVADVSDPVDAVRAFVERLLSETDATPLPDLQSARGLPLAAFKSLAAYQRDVLMVDDEEDLGV
jgi:membrane associated rhomboid family serine protease